MRPLAVLWLAVAWAEAFRGDAARPARLVEAARPHHVDDAFDASSIVNALHDIGKALKAKENCESSDVSTQKLIRLLGDFDHRMTHLEQKLEAVKNLSSSLLHLEARLSSLENVAASALDAEVEEANTLELELQVKEAVAKRAPPKQEGAAPVAFDVYRTGPFYDERRVISYDGANLNLGNNLNLSTGLFTAPDEGVYVFAFHCLANATKATFVRLVLNGENVGGAYARHDDLSAPKQRTVEAESMLAQSVVLQLHRKDQVGVYAYHGNIRDGAFRYTHFTGYRIY